MQENTVNQFAHFDCLQCLFSHIVEWEGDKCCNKGIKCCQPNPGLTVFQPSPHCLGMTIEFDLQSFKITILFHTKLFVRDV